MTDDKKTLKFQMMMSPAEAEVLDDWMFKNRVRSRAEAIRRLCQIGLMVDEQISKISDDLAKATGLMEVTEGQWNRLIKQHDGDKDLGLYARRTALLFGHAFASMQDTAYSAHNRLVDLIVAINTLMNAANPADGLAQAKEVNEEARERWERWRQEELEQFTALNSGARRRFAEMDNVEEAIAMARNLLDVGEVGDEDAGPSS